MNPAQLLTHFDRISDAPDAIPRLRRFILDLVVRGKLVEQDPRDEPASELLKRIQAKKERLFKAGKVKQQKILPPLMGLELAFSIPDSWVWARLDALTEKITDGEHLSPNKTTVGMPLLTATHVTSQGVTLNNPQFVSIEDGHKSRQRCDPRRGDILICSRGTIGRCAVINTDEIFCLMGSVILARFPKETSSVYFNYFLSTDRAQMQMRGMSGATAVQALYLKDIRLCPVALPPLAEQHRIVAKVDELMALCDRLEAAQAARESRRDRLVIASLNRLNNGADADAFRDHARFYFNHLPRLTTRTEHIQQLRQTILNLAVRGKLVPQDPNDDPASELLKRIQAEKARLVKEGKIKKENPILASEGIVTPFEIPETWVWVPLGALTELITKGSSPKWQGVAYVSKDDGILFITSENIGNYRLRKLDELKYVENRFNEIEPRSILRFGDILMNLVGASIGRTAVYNLRNEANINQAVALIRLIQSVPNLLPSFLLHYLNSPSAIDHMMASQVVNAQPNISLKDAREFPIPTPPLAEQQRIVAKVDELMSLCDRLEAQLTTTHTESRRLLEAVLHHALAPTV